jgi:lipoprotein-anchoring transpeptidase ErfK/SrfK
VAGAVALVVALAFAGACSKDATWNTPGETADPPKVTIVTPPDGATDVITAVELQFTLEGTQTAEVALTDASGNQVTGAMRADGSSWLPDRQLSYETQYTATITATKSDGSSASATTTFTTMGQSAQTARVQSFNGDNVTYGVGMPIIINFDINVPESQRAALERRLFVTSTPAQEGSWHWISSYYHDGGSQVRYRPKEYWQTGTRVQARIALGGMPWGYEGVYGRNDLTLDFTIGDSQIVEVDNTTKRMTITVNGQAIDREIKVSLGRPSLPSSSGHMLVMRREHPRVFDTTDRASGGYRTEVQYAEQITTSGEFIHDAPWSVSQQGNTNVSHGCLNVSPENGEWLYSFLRVGDPVIVTSTGKPLQWGDGFTDWDIPFEEYQKGSALYTPPSSAATTTPSA